MPKPTDDKKEPVAKVDENNASSSLNPPKVDPATGKPTQAAITSFKQAHGIAKTLWNRAREGRFSIGGAIAKAYGGAAPFSSADLAKNGENWRNNFSTNFLGSVVDRIVPQFKDPLVGGTTVTNSNLPATYENAAKKSDTFRKGITKLFREWPAWDDFLSLLAQENVLYGNNAPAWIDDDWRPRFFAYGQILMPEGSGQHSSKVQVAIYQQDMLLHEFLDKISDPEAAVDAGYDMDGCAKAANEAASPSSRGELTAIQQEDRVREQGNIAASYDTGSKNVTLFHILVREYSGGVNLWTVTDNTGYPVRYVENLHKEMADAITVFTLQTGNGKYFGSKGTGRFLTNLHTAIERHRCTGLDTSYLSALPIALVEKDKMNTIAPAVRHPFIMMDSSAMISSESVSFDITSFKEIDAMLVNIAESIAGAFIPPQLSNEGSPNTKIEAGQKAEREMAVKNGVLGRWMRCFAELISAMQRKVCSEDNMREAARIWQEEQKKEKSGFRIITSRISSWLKAVMGKAEWEKAKLEEERPTKIADKEAVEFLLDMLRAGLSTEEIGVLALSSAGSSMDQSTESDDQKTIAFIESKLAANTPYLNQKTMTVMQAELVIGEDRAQRIAQPDSEDPAVLAEAQRMQLVENSEMIAGTGMPVSPRDSHKIHRQVMMGTLPQLAQSIAQQPTPELVGAMGLMIPHYISHLSEDRETPEPEKAQEEAQVKQWMEAQKAAQSLLQKQQKAAMEAGVNPGAQPMPAMPGMNIDPAAAVTLQADMKMHEDNVQLKHRELDIRQQEQQHKEQMDGLDAIKEATKLVTDKTQQAQQQGSNDALREQEIQQQANQTVNPA